MGQNVSSYTATLCCFFLFFCFQEKCIQYWPALMDMPWNVGGNLSVTLELQTQYAAYRVKKILLENVSPKGQLLCTLIFSQRLANGDGEITK